MKKITMKKLSLVSSLSSLVLLMACGDDITNDSVVKAQSYGSKADLPKCTDKFEGAFATVPSKKEVYVCSEGSWKSLVNNASAISEDGKFACSTVELSSKKGYKVVCGGDSVAVVTNGAKGDTGSKGLQGPTGLAGDKGTDGSGTNGRDLTLPTGDCAVLDAGLNYVVYDCGDSTYVKNLSGYKADLKTWNILGSGFNNLQDLASNAISDAITTRHLKSPSGKSVATLDRVMNKEWKASNASEQYNLIGNVERGNLAIKGKASIEVLDEAQENSYYGLEPMVAVEILLSDWTDVSEWGGFCLTYEAEKEMELIVGSPSYFARVPIKASSKETTIDILNNTFVPDDEHNKLETILKSATKYIIIKVAGSLTKGKYENNFAIYEIGAYGKCGGPTVNKIKPEILNKKGKTGSFTDKRNGESVKYNTVTIDGDVWMAENLKVSYTYNKLNKFGSDAEEVKDGEGKQIPVNLSYCHADEDTCKKYGPFYTWSAAMDSMGLYNDVSVYQDEDSNEVAGRRCGYGMTCALTTPVKGICPEGWHLPSTEEIDKLFKAAGYDEDFSGTTLLAGRALGIIPSETDNSNWLGFNATPAGYFTGSEESVGILSILWNANDLDDEYANVFFSSYNAGYGSWRIGQNNLDKRHFAPVRCVQDKAKN